MIINKFLTLRNSNPAIYALTVEDVQNVALKELGRELNDEEIKKIIEPIADNIEWWDAIETAISLHFANV